MLPNNYKVNKTVIIPPHVWYLTIIPMPGEYANFWTFHKCSGMSEQQAKTAFEREHFRQVDEQLAEKMKRDLQPELNS